MSVVGSFRWYFNVGSRHMSTELLREKDHMWHRSQIHHQHLSIPPIMHHQCATYCLWWAGHTLQRRHGHLCVCACDSMDAFTSTHPPIHPFTLHLVLCAWTRMIEVGGNWRGLYKNVYTCTSTSHTYVLYSLFVFFLSALVLSPCDQIRSQRWMLIPGLTKFKILLFLKPCP